jgi:peptidoglycan/xylan/chitin deacetylase (PgdA/CDA1 family)
MLWSKHHRKHTKLIIIFTGIIVAGIAVFVFNISQPRSDNQTAKPNPIVAQPNPAPAQPVPTPTVAPKVQTPPPKHDFTIPPVVNGIPPVLTNFKTTDPVVFLGIDDGAFKDPSVVKIMKDNNIKASLFLAKSFIAGNPDFFKDIVANGSLIEDHTLTHNLQMVKVMTYDEQKAEICGMADYEQAQYGRRPVFVRPPGGAYSSTFLQAAGACGMRAVVNWIAKANGGSMQYQIGHVLRPGDIVLLHFRPEFKQDMQAFIDAEKAAGLHTELLENWQ